MKTRWIAFVFCAALAHADRTSVLPVDATVPSAVADAPTSTKAGRVWDVVQPVSSDFVVHRAMDSVNQSEKIGLRIVKLVEEIQSLSDRAIQREERDRTLPSFAKDRSSSADLYPKQQRTLFASREVSWPQAPLHAKLKKLSRQLKEQVRLADASALDTCYWGAKAKTMQAWETMIRAEEACQWLRHTAFSAEEVRPREVSTKAGEVLLPVPWDEGTQKVFLRNEGDGNFGVAIWKRIKTQRAGVFQEQVETVRLTVHVDEEGRHQLMTATPPLTMDVSQWEKL